MTDKEKCYFAIFVLVVTLSICAYFCSKKDKCSVCDKSQCECPVCTGCSDGNDPPKAQFVSLSSSRTPDRSVSHSIKSPMTTGYMSLPGDSMKYTVKRHESNLKDGFHGPLGHSATDLSSFTGVL